MADEEIISAGWCVWSVAGDCPPYFGLLVCYLWELQTVLPPHTDRKHQAFGVACSERVNCTNVFRMGSNNLSSRIHAPVHLTLSSCLWNLLTLTFKGTCAVGSLILREHFSC
jgi:hypothetical protein